MSSYVEIFGRFVPILGTVTAVIVLLAAINWFLKRRWQNNPDAQFRFQLIMLSLTLAGVLVTIIALPIDNALRGQLLSLIGILLSAAIALSSTTFIGNIMAGIMLKIVKNVRPGDFITVAELTGRITEMDLLHTEIQTELRDLVTVPNLYMVTQPLKVVRASGSIITAEVSLGYDVSRVRATELLIDASAKAGLKDGFVHIRELGDYSVTYRIAGLLEDIKSLISARSALLVAMLDTLHEANIEIVSPNFMNTRTLEKDEIFIPDPSIKRPETVQASAEEIAFDKAEDASSIEDIKSTIQQIDSQLKDLADSKEEQTDAQRQVLEEEKERLVEQLKSATEKIKSRDSAESNEA